MYADWIKWCKLDNIIYTNSQKYSITLGLVIRDQYYCCRDCHFCEKMTGDGYPYKFVTFYENEEYFYFFKLTIL